MSLMSGAEELSGERKMGWWWAPVLSLMVFALMMSSVEAYAEGAVPNAVPPKGRMKARM